jgi:hypothetical protein
VFGAMPLSIIIMSLDIIAVLSAADWFCVPEQALSTPSPARIAIRVRIMLILPDQS